MQQCTTDDDDDDNGSGSGDFSGAIVGIAVGFLFILGVVVLLAVRKSKSNVNYTNPPEKAAVEDRMEQDSATNEGSASFER